MILSVPNMLSTKPRLVFGALSVSLALIVLIGAPGCSKGGSGSETSTSAPSTDASPSASGRAAPNDSGSAAAVGGDAGTGEPIAPVGMQSIPERFAMEARNRPTGTVRVEDVYAAFQGAGATLREQRQHLAAPFLAHYCVGAQTGEDVHLSVCEYTDAAKAKEGRAMSDQAFGTVPNRTLHQNGATTLTVRVGGSSAADRELAKKLVQTFSTLTVKR